MDDGFSSLKGQLLIASANLSDPNFFRTVVLVTEHTSEGAMGLVLNRPSQLEVSSAIPELAELLDDGATVYIGGPVQPNAVVALAELDDPARAAALVLGRIGFIRPDDEPASLAGDIVSLRVFAGYSGWGEGQLEAELDEEAWYLEPALPADVFSADPAELWADVLRRKGGPFAILARLPVDPSVN
jgi:putative transcriptional regulator